MIGQFGKVYSMYKPSSEWLAWNTTGLGIGIARSITPVSLRHCM